MADKLEITIEMIIHATEDTKKILDSFEEFFGIQEIGIGRARMAGMGEPALQQGRGGRDREEGQPDSHRHQSDLPARVHAAHRRRPALRQRDGQRHEGQQQQYPVQ